MANNINMHENKGIYMQNKQKTLNNNTKHNI